MRKPSTPKILSLLLSVCLPLLLSACASWYDVPQTLPTHVKNYFPETLIKTWRLEYMRESPSKRTLVPPPEGQTPSLTFYETGTRAGGWGGCNGYSAEVRISGTYMFFGTVSSTKRGCFGDTESYFFEMLSKIDNFELKDGELRLRQESNILLVFTVEQPASRSSLYSE